MDIRLIPNKKINGVFQINGYRIKKARNGCDYLVLSLSLEHIIIRGYIWNDCSSILKNLLETNLVIIEGIVKELYEQYIIDITSITPFKKDDTKVNIKDISGGLIRLLNSIEDTYCRRLIDLFIKDQEFLKKFIQYPAGLNIHHNRYGGLLEHTYRVMYQSYLTHMAYKEVFNRDLLLTGAFLHDVGKVIELSQDNNSYTDEGRLLGHINLGIMMVNEKISNIKGFPNKLALSIRHMIASHHGIKRGSDVAPKTAEALILHRIDGLDIMMDKLKMIQKCNGWSAYDNVLQTEVYFG